MAADVFKIEAANPLEKSVTTCQVAVEEKHSRCYGDVATDYLLMQTRHVTEVLVVISGLSWHYCEHNCHTVSTNSMEQSSS
jgi:hypothetical protein